MKAQSGLAGDRKRRAEMTRPRFGGATNWMNGIDMMKKSVGYVSAIRNQIAGASALAQCAGVDAAIRNASHPQIRISNTYSEVNHRPAGR